jgi:hypothetical protein
VESNGFMGMLVAAASSSTRSKFFVLPQAFSKFRSGVLLLLFLARAIRYFGVGYLAIRYGNQALPFLVQHKLQVILFIVLFVVVSYLLSHLVLRHKPNPSTSPNKTTLSS